MGACIITFWWLLAPSISECIHNMPCLTQQSSAIGSLGFRRDPIFSAEVFYTTGRINHRLLPGVIGMTLRAHFNTYLRFRRNSLVCCTANTIDDTFHRLRMNICFHADNHPLWTDTLTKRQTTIGYALAKEDFSACYQPSFQETPRWCPFCLTVPQRVPLIQRYSSGPWTFAKAILC